MLTGESVPVHPEAGTTLHAGTFVVEGSAYAVVVAAGARTRLAGIADLTRQARRRPSPLAVQLHRVVRTVAAVAIGVGVGFFALALLLGGNGHGSAPVRRRARGARAGGAAADCHAVPGPGGPADGREARAGAPAGGGRDPRRHHLHLHRQDRHPDPERDDLRRGMDTGRNRHDGAGHRLRPGRLPRRPGRRGAGSARELAATRSAPAAARCTRTAIGRPKETPPRSLDVPPPAPA